LFFNEIWKRKTFFCWVGLFTNGVKNILFNIYFNYLIKYSIITTPLKLKIGGKGYINGLVELLKLLDGSKMLELTKLKTIILSEFPHIILTNDTPRGGQIFTHSKTVYITPEDKIETTNIGKNQNILFSLINAEDVIDLPEKDIIKKIFTKLNISSVEDYIGLIFKLNIHYWCDITEKLIWQSSDGSLNKVLGPEQLPLSIKKINSEMENFKMDPKTYLRYKYQPQQFYDSTHFESILLCNQVKKDVLNKKNTELYTSIRNNIDTGNFIVYDTKLRTDYEGLSQYIKDI
jgi:hypothetical protein